jgi:3-phosphoshikimate 1-carboxyvinyltransferase
VLTVDGPTLRAKARWRPSWPRNSATTCWTPGAVPATALAAQDAGISLEDEPALAELAGRLELRFTGHQVFLGGRDITDPLRLESTGGMASRVSVHPAVRRALHGLQLSFRRAPGLVADGRDMGTVVFPEATLKVFLTASADARAERRHKQLISKGNSANIDDLRAELMQRDERDRNRAVAPLKPAEDAMLLDNSSLSVEASVEQVLSWWQQRRPF